MEKRGSRPSRRKCGSNLRQIGQAIALYANENHGDYPRTVYVPGAAPTQGTNPSAANPFGPGGPLPNDTTAALFLLLRTQNLPPEIFICPYTDVTRFDADDAGDLQGAPTSPTTARTWATATPTPTPTTPPPRPATARPPT